MRLPALLSLFTLAASVSAWDVSSYYDEHCNDLEGTKSLEDEPLACENFDTIDPMLSVKAATNGRTIKFYRGEDCTYSWYGVFAKDGECISAKGKPWKSYQVL
ncbi:hypothetical protein BDW62DRAFT_200134 [Aspergillus aurantiobrunneus]